jgi:hypothetical protein
MNKYTFIVAITFVMSNYAVAQIDLNKIKHQVEQEAPVIQKQVENLPQTVTGGNSGNAIGSLTDSEIIQGLKEALTKGSGIASQALNKVDGYYQNPKVKIPFPQDVTKVANALREVGYGKKVDEFELTLNRSAEQAAKEAAPIFSNAVTQMSFSDAKSILTGPDTAATGYLRKTTYNSLFKSFSPHITKALGNNQATSKWTEITTIYNKLPTTKTKVNTDLVSYTTNKALKGLFLLVADEEAKIRKDPVARTTDILKKVFGNK